MERQIIVTVSRHLARFTKRLQRNGLSVVLGKRSWSGREVRVFVPGKIKMGVAYALTRAALA